MSTIRLRSSGGRSYRVDLPEPMAGLQSAFLFAFHKSGSTLMDNMIRDYCKPLNIPTFSLFNAAFDAGVQTNRIKEDATVCFSKIGCIYTGFRHYPEFDLDLEGVKTFLLVRDPRDMLVSMYYSVTKSHVLPNRNKLIYLLRRKRASLLSLDDFVLRNFVKYRNDFLKYRQALPSETLTTYRYEDIIYEKQSWLKSMVKSLGIPEDPKLIARIARKYDIFPETENQDKHIRQVHPGNYKSRLAPETIEVLNQKLALFLRFYNYL